jgi:hypothetical protein
MPNEIFPDLPSDISGQALLRARQIQWKELAAQFGEDQLVDRILDYIAEVDAKKAVEAGPVGEAESTVV